ncbi:MAG: hypothetical protein Q8P18_03755 [Pseudomonadota bacterium]|nr:hypothetical protein [Pseudomonadota bacterium]
MLLYRNRVRPTLPAGAASRGAAILLTLGSASCCYGSYAAARADYAAAVCAWDATCRFAEPTDGYVAACVEGTAALPLPDGWCFDDCAVVDCIAALRERTDACAETGGGDADAVEWPAACEGLSAPCADGGAAAR